MGKKVKAKARNPRKIQPRVPSGFPSDRSGCAVDDEGVSKSGENCSHYKKGKAELSRILLSVRSSQGVIVSCDHCRDDPPEKKRNKDLGKQSKKKGGVKNVDVKSDASEIWVCLDCSRYFCGGVSAVMPYGHARRHSKQERHPWVVRHDDISIAWCLTCNLPIPAEMLAVDANNDLIPVAEASSSSMKIDNSDESLAFGKIKGRVVRGLINLGNTCFFNSVMQNIFALDIMRDYFSVPERSSGPLNMSLKKLFMDTSADADAKGALNPKALFGSICSKAPQFRGYQQQDSHELLRYLLDGLQTEDIFYRKSSDTSSKPDSNFIDAIFGGRLSSTVSCKACGHSSTIQEPFLDLSLPIPSRKQASKKAPLHSSRRSRPPPRETSRYQKSREKRPSKGPSIVEYRKPESSSSLSECATSSTPILEEPVATAAVKLDCTWMDFISTDNTTETEPDSFSQTEDFVHQDHDGGENHDNLIDPTFREPVVLPDPRSDEDVTLTAQTSGIILLGYEPLDSSVQKTDEVSPSCRNSGSMDSVSAPVTGREDTEVEIDGLGDLFNENEATSDLITEPRVDDIDDDVDMLFWSGSNNESNQDEIDDSSSPVSINSCLALFIKPEVLSGEHGWHCENCSKALDNRDFDIRKGQRRVTSEKHGHVGLSTVGGGLRVGPEMDSDGLVVDPESIDVIENGKNDSADARSNCTETLVDHMSGSKGKEIGSADSESCSMSEQPENQDDFMIIRDRTTGTSSLENVASCVVDSCVGESNGHTLVGESLDSCEKNNANGIHQGNEKLYQGSHKVNFAKNRSGKEIKSEILKVKRVAVKSFLIYRPPPILTIHLKRFSQDARGRLSKLRGHVVFQEMLDLKPYMESRSEEEIVPTTYHLVGVVEHSGGMTGGHYIAYIRGGGSKGKLSSWFYVSDAHVREASLSEVLKSEAYLLFYESDRLVG